MGKRLTSEERKKLCSAKHNGKYDYSQADFTLSREPTIIICPEHGIFKQSFDNHYSKGQKCPYCMKPSRDLSSFITEAKKKHGDRYDYSETKYVNAHALTKIICKEHGPFMQTPNAHLSGKGCPLCGNKRTYLEDNVKRILDDLKVKYVYQYKPEWLKRKANGSLSLDFFLPQVNVAIECQGKQHFGFGGFGKNFDFEKQKERDEWKYHRCLEKNVKILYFATIKNLPKQYLGEIFTEEAHFKNYINYLFGRN